MNFKTGLVRGQAFSVTALLSLALALLLTACSDPTPTKAPATTSAASTTTAAQTTAASSAATTTSASSIATVTPAPAATTPASAATTAVASTTSAAATTPGNSSNQITLTMWVMPNSSKPAEDMQKVLADFYVKYPNIKVNVVQQDWSNAFNKLTAATTGGESPDVTQLGTTWVGALTATGALRTFSDAEISSVGGAQNFTEAAWTTTRLAGSNDVTAIPWFVETRAILYRTDVLQKTGLDPAQAFKDWDSFTTTLKKMKETGMVKAPFAYPGKSDWNVLHNFAPWVWGAGGEMLSTDNKKAAFNNDAGIKGFLYYASLYTQGLVLKEALEKNTADVENFYRNGDVAAIISGPWLLRGAKLSKTQDDNSYADSPAGKYLGVAEIPSGPQGAKPFVGGSNLAIFKSSKNQDAALKLVQYLVSKKAQIDYASVTGNLPATREGQSEASLSTDPLYKPFLQSLKDGKSYPTIAAWGPIETTMVKNLSILWDDVAGINGPFDASKVKERLDTAAQEVDTAIATGK